MLSASVDKREIVKEFQLRGWLLRPNTLQFLVQRLGAIQEGNQRHSLLTKFLHSLPTPTSSNSESLPPSVHDP